MTQTAFTGDRFDEVIEIFKDMSTSDDFETLLTLPAYERIGRNTSTDILSSSESFPWRPAPAVAGAEFATTGPKKAKLYRRSRLENGLLANRI